MDKCYNLLTILFRVSEMNNKHQELSNSRMDQIFEKIVERRVQKLIDKKIREIEYIFSQQKPELSQKMKRFFKK